MKGMGTDEKAIIAVLAHRTSQQRLEISRSFKAAFGKDLIKDLKSELSGNLETIVLAMMQERSHYEAECLRKAMKGIGTDETVLIEVLCTRTNSEIQHIKASYTELYKRDLEGDIQSETSGHLRRLFVSVLQACRPENTPVDMARVKADAEALRAAGVGKIGTDESKFNEVLITRSFAHLRAVFREYATLTGSDILRTLEHEMSGDIKGGMKAIVHSVIDRPSFFADRIYKSMHGAGTDDDSLIRLVVTRSEVDMVEIKQAFLTNHKKTLAKMISDDCSGDYKRMLVAIVGE